MEKRKEKMEAKAETPWNTERRVVEARQTKQQQLEGRKSVSCR